VGDVIVADLVTLAFSEIHVLCITI